MKRRRLGRVLAAVCLLALSATSTMAQGGTAQTQADKERREAQRTWEQMVKVKGGRERLHSITNMLLTLGDKPRDTRIELYVYPSKSWSWTQAPPAPKHIRVFMANLEHGVLVGAHNTGLDHSERLTEERIHDIRREMLRNAAAILLETKWMQPEPIRVTRQRVGKERLDIIETRLRYPDGGREERMDFVIEPESLLVYRVIQYYEGKPLSYYCFDDYTTVDGIQMPRRTGDIDYQFWNEECRYPYTLKVQFNVDYDRRIFERPPSVEAGPEAWKPKR